MKKYLTKFTVDILPSVAATVIGAYIVNHYIVSKPAPTAPVASVVSTVDPKAVSESARPEANKAPDASAEVVNPRGPGVKAKGISERAILEKTAVEKPQEKSPEKSHDKSGENVTEKAAETAPAPVETRRPPPAPREKTAARTVPTPAPAASAPAPVAPAEAASASEERRDANDLARAAIDRLRGPNDGSPRPQETARPPEVTRAPDAARIPEAPRVVLAPAVRPLPPPVMVATPSLEPRVDDPARPTPPADIPSRPLDLRAEAGGPLARERTTVAEDVLSAAKSVFHAVLPGTRAGD
nr:hypothetical protein [Bradyrhizobium sp.]